MFVPNKGLILKIFINIIYKTVQIQTCCLHGVDFVKLYHFFNASLTLGAILVPKISIDFIIDLCEGPPTSMCAEKRVKPNSSCICKILSIDSLASPIIKWPLLLLPASYCPRWYGGKPRLLPNLSICEE